MFTSQEKVQVFYVPRNPIAQGPPSACARRAKQKEKKIKGKENEAQELKARNYVTGLFPLILGNNITSDTRPRMFRILTPSMG